MSRYQEFRIDKAKILEERARRVEKAIEQQDNRERLDVIVLQISGEKYALPVEKVLSVQEGITIKPLAGTPSHISGIANVRGHVCSVLNLADILGIANPASQNLSLVLLDEAGAHLAFAVEAVQDVQELVLDDLASLPQESPYLRGMLLDGTVLLNLEAIVNDPDLLVNQE
jgi:purine-binding chemotaxis protein CheW